jgi:glycerol 3-phosphatase-2
VLWVFDLDGVVWLAGRPIPGSPEAVERLRAAGARVAFVTNNSGPTLAEQLQRLAAAGVAVGPDELATSAQAAASLLGEGTRVAFLGGPGVEEALSGAGVELVGFGHGPEAVVVGRSLRLDFAELSAAAAAVRGGARFVATNTDATFPTPSGPEPGAGALVSFLEVASGRKAEVAGKPEAAMAALVQSRYGRPDVVVGDRAETDGGFARRLGSDFVLVLTGVTARTDLPVEPAPALVADDLAAAVEAWLAGRPSRGQR